MAKTIWIINQYASTPETGVIGRHYYLARGLEALGYKVYIIAASYTHLLRQPPTDMNGRFHLERREGVNMVWVEMPSYQHAHSKQRVLNWFVFPLRLLKISKALPEEPDAILYSSPSLVGYLGAERLARRLKATLAFEVRDIWPLTLCAVGGYSPKHVFIRFLQWVEERAYRNADVVISNLKNAHEHMVKHGLDKAKFHWIPNGVSITEVEKPQPLDEQVSGQLPETGFIVGYTGTIGHANCLGTLIEAAILLEDRTDIKFVMVGRGKDKDELERIVKDNSLNNVVFIDAIPKPQIQSMLERFDCLYIGLSKSPLFRHGVSPNKLFDYLYAGKPILYAIESGDYHPVSEAGAGQELPAEDAKAVADAILAMHDMPVERRERMGVNGRKAVLEQYEYGALAQKMAHALFASERNV